MADDIDDDFDSGDSEAPMESQGTGSASSGIAIDYCMAAKEKEREELDSQVAEFLARGGTIDHVDTHVCADPPQKPSSSYGSRPI